MFVSLSYSSIKSVFEKIEFQRALMKDSFPRIRLKYTSQSVQFVDNKSGSAKIEVLTRNHFWNTLQDE